jgi:hypothetical protein
MADKIKDYIQGYRANPKNKYGANDYMETLPTEYDKYNMQKYISAMREGRAFGVPQLTPQQLTNMALHEGRDDFGFNYTTDVEHSKKAKNIVDSLTKQGFDDESALFAGVVYDKYQTSKRLNKPFEEIWNGTGINDVGQSGADYAKKFKDTSYAATNAKNKELIDYINRATKKQFTPQEDTLHRVRNYEFLEQGPMGLGGAKVYKDLMYNVKDPNTLKILKQADNVTIHQIFMNKVRENYGLNPVATDTQFKKGYNMGDYVQAAHLAAELPEVKQYMDRRAQEAIKNIENTKTPVFKEGGKIKLPDGYKKGGSSGLI